jgi:hypothetical protein
MGCRCHRLALLVLADAPGISNDLLAVMQERPLQYTPRTQQVTCSGHGLYC